MADVPGGEGGGGGGRHQKKRAKKGSTRIDMTPMVDLAFLLLTFFILTTTMYKPSTLQMAFPLPNKDPQDIPKVNNALTLLLTKKDAIFYYAGGFKAGETQLTKSNMSDVRKVIQDMNKWTLDSLNLLKSQRDAGKLTPEEFDALKKKTQKAPAAIFCIIKPDKDAVYRNVIDMVDEMSINGVDKFAVQDSLKAEEQTLLDVEKPNL